MKINPVNFAVESNMFEEEFARANMVCVIKNIIEMVNGFGMEKSNQAIGGAFCCDDKIFFKRG